MNGRPLLTEYQFLSPVVFPFAYQVDRNTDAPDWIFVAFGRFIDTALSINADCGIRVYRGKFASAGIIKNSDWKAPTQPPIWAGTCDVAQSIPWGQFPCQFVIEFYRAANTTGAQSSIEFVMTPYKGN